MRIGLKPTLIAAIASLALAAPAAAKTYEVNKRSDHAPNGCKKKDCTLREAVIAANARSGPDRIVLPKNKTYHLRIVNSLPTGEEESAEGDLDVTDSLSVTHPGKGVAKVDANGVDRVFDVYAGAPLSLKRIGVTGGDADYNDADAGTPNGGGGIRAAADLTLQRSRVVRNSQTAQYGGGIDLYDDAGLTLRRSSVSDNESDDDGGAIDGDDGAIVVQRSKIVGNTADGNGGAMYFFSPDSRIAKSTIAQNRAGSSGGGIHNTGGELTVTASTISGNSSDGSGGGINITNSGELTMTNSTIEGNASAQEGGGIANPDGDVFVNAVTIVRNAAEAAGGGVIYGTAAPGFDVENSLIALNSSPLAPDCFADPVDPFDSGGHNLIGDDTDCPGFDATGDFVNSNPKLGKLKNNGGPTQTVALKKGSPAINKAAKSAPNKDQRGVKRGKKPDIGAYERVKKKKKKGR
jgi:hypothetical protein